MLVKICLPLGFEVKQFFIISLAFFVVIKTLKNFVYNEVELAKDRLKLRIDVFVQSIICLGLVNCCWDFVSFPIPPS